MTPSKRNYTKKSEFWEKKKETSVVYNFLLRARRHYEFLKINSDSEFFEKMGCHPKISSKWHSTGIKKIYYFVLNLLDQINPPSPPARNYH